MGESIMEFAAGCLVHLHRCWCRDRVVGNDCVPCRNRYLRLSRIDEDGRDIERLADADIAAVAADDLPAGHAALVVQQLEPGSRSLDAISLLEQFEPRRPDAVKSQLCDSPLRAAGIRQRAHRMDRLHLGDETRMENDLADAPAYR